MTSKVGSPVLCVHMRVCMCVRVLVCVHVPVCAHARVRVCVCMQAGSCLDARVPAVSLGPEVCHRPIVQSSNWEPFTSLPPPAPKVITAQTSKTIRTPQERRSILELKECGRQGMGGPRGPKVPSQASVPGHLSQPLLSPQPATPLPAWGHCFHSGSPLGT